MTKKATAILEGQGSAAAIEHLQSQSDPLAILTAFNELGRHAYWQLNDLDAAVALSQAGMAYGEEQVQTAEAELARELNLQLRAIAYNLASYTWPGWDEDWIEEIPQKYLQLGLEAAQYCLALTQQPAESELRHSRAHWMLAAHQLAAGQYAQAKANFAKGIEYAEQAQAHADVLLNHGFTHLVSLIEDPNDQGAQSALEAIQAELAKLDHGDAFIQQMEDALRVFGGPGAPEKWGK